MRSYRSRNRRRARGFNLIEILVVLAIIGLLAGVAAPRIIEEWNRSRAKTALLNAQGFRAAVNIWKLHGNEECPTPTKLIEAKLIDRGASPNDPWSNPFVISCEDDGVTVSSAGPDRKAGTPDDIIAPPEPRAARRD